MTRGRGEEDLSAVDIDLLTVTDDLDEVMSALARAEKARKAAVANSP